MTAPRGRKPGCIDLDTAARVHKAAGERLIAGFGEDLAGGEDALLTLQAVTLSQLISLHEATHPNHTPDQIATALTIEIAERLFAWSVVEARNRSAIPPRRDAA